ncbi:NAD(P)/FAD-dependent oxidoreductase [Nocardia blacklockiae]|uniref:NAD(P)/FAD-dependent oxidoreductase n=1 Tax=Nocardia blacklockiae TaxID=480036 RepID=UPI0018951E5A|nr:NAD(P)/FAD-dependent oxidoreductase [Nocardia blacklockiae]MBF6173755.1 NAD(P)/FAD-dependent oxidoreductase [Nocardia blacklockiae]
MTEELKDRYDVVVIGGGAAGLNGALMLARARRSVLVIDAGEPRNAPAEGVHGLLGREGMSPKELLERGRAEVRQYGGQVVTGTVATAAREGEDFVVTTADGRGVRARRLLVASGLADELPDVAGLWDRWGRDVVHCPYCHGWEVRDRPIGVLANGPMSVHGALLWRQWSDDVTLFCHTMDTPTGEQAEQLAARGIRVVTGEVAGLESADDRLTGVRLADGTVIAREVIAAPPRMVARADFLADLGLRPADHPSGMGEHIPADPTGRTEVPGVWAAGNVTDLSAQVGGAAAAGAVAGGHINADLITEDTDRAVEAARTPFSPAAEAEVAELVTGDRRHGV